MGMSKADRKWLREYDRKKNKWFRVHRNGKGDESYRKFPIFGDLEYGDYAIWIGEGGWCGRRWMTSEELRAAQDRWVKASYNASGPQFKEATIQEGGIIQCGGCRYFGAFDLDYGLCCNPDSTQDGRVCFEHGGCEKHSNIEKGIYQWPTPRLKPK